MRLRICLVTCAALGAVACGGSAAAPPHDAGKPDTGTVDASTIDAGHPDAAINEGGVIDASPGEGGTDSGMPLARASKLDLLFMVDNSASMGDKQSYLQQAATDLVTRLLNPNCVDPSNPTTVLGVSSNGACSQGVLEFLPVKDMHLAVISSSLGSRGGNLCPPTETAAPPYSNLSAHTDDQAHLLNRTLTLTPDAGSEGVVADAVDSIAGQAGYLYWYPQGSDAGAGQPLASEAQLATDFQELVGGAGFFGCGIESQLESWYRFLVQPDPYASISVDGTTSAASWTGVDAVILQERHDFLRPDSVVAVVTLTDENDSEIDVRSLGGTGVEFMNTTFDPPHGTTPCATNPADPSCTSCAFLTAQQQAADPACASTYSAINDWGYDPNLRHVHMKAKYGVDPQYPLTRYTNGLTSTTVPDRTGEYPDPTMPYVGTNDCTNPLFASSLPDGTATDAATLCHLPMGTRPAGHVFFAHIGGVPYQLLHFTAGNPQATALSAADWVKILGNNPQAFDYTGIDPHMIESSQPRAALPAPTSANNADPISGREWITDQGAGHVLAVDRQYACIFPLPTPRDCTQVSNEYECDCPATATLTAAQTPPVCNPSLQTQQVGAKAYPTIRELTLAKLLGGQAVVSSLCPIHPVDMMGGADPLYGYRPAMTALVDLMASSLAQ